MARKLGKSLKGKTIVVFGASSNIGSKFVLEAVEREARIIAVARNTSKVPHPKRETNGSIEVIQADITRLRDVRKALQGHKVDATVNFAASFSGNLSEAKSVNLIGEKNILQACLEFDIKRHIYISTIATLMPKENIYGNTKRQAEEVVKTSQLDWIILRYAHVLGSRTWDQPFKLILPYFRFAVPKAPTDANNATFPYLTIDTAIDAVFEAIYARPNQTITVFDGKITVGDFISTMEEVYKVRISFLPSKLLRFLNMFFGKYFPQVSGLSAAVEFLANPPSFENETMKQELHIQTRDFHKWIKTHFPQNMRQGII